MQTIHVGNLAAYEAGQSAAAHASAIARDVEGEMAAFFRANPGCTEDDVFAAGFDARQVARYRISAARRAARDWTRRLS